VRAVPVLATALLAAVLLAGCASAARPAPAYEPRPASAAAPVRGYQTVSDEVAVADSLPPLRTVDLPQGVEEIRIWVGFGLLAPYRMLRIVRDADGVGGELVVWWESSQAETPGSSIDPDMGEWLEQNLRCALRARNHDVDVCRVRLRSEPSWSGLLHQLEKLRVWTLPGRRDRDVKPGQPLGAAVVVELRNGAQYRVYAYTDADFSASVNGLAAQEMVHLVYGVGGSKTTS
jgi:hypothetical protein